MKNKKYFNYYPQPRLVFRYRYKIIDACNLINTGNTFLFRILFNSLFSYVFIERNERFRDRSFETWIFTRDRIVKFKTVHRQNFTRMVYFVLITAPRETRTIRTKFRIGTVRKLRIPLKKLSNLLAYNTSKRRMVRIRFIKRTINILANDSHDRFGKIHTRALFN